MKTIAAIAFSLIILSLSSWAKDTVKRFSKDEVYCIDTISLASGPKAKWIIFKNGKYDAGPDNAAGVLSHFDKQSDERKAHGIFIHSKTHSIPLTDEEKRWMTPHLLKQHQDPKWRASENALVEELVQECNKRGIQVWVNISSNVNGNWKLLTTPARSEQDGGGQAATRAESK
jgi:hypothetical protein